MAASHIVDRTGTNDAAGTSLATSAAMDVDDGDLLVAFMGCEGEMSSPSISDGGSNTFTMRPILDGGTLDTVLGYRLAGVNNNSATFTAQFGASVTYRRLIVMQFRSSGKTWALSDATTIEGTGTGSSTSMTSGNITTTGDDIVMCGAGGNVSDISLASQTLGTDDAATLVGLEYFATSWLIAASGEAGVHANFTIITGDWQCHVIAFKAEAGGATILRQMMQHHGG